MKLTHIKATNLLGARNFSTELRAPVLVVASDSNGSGKSSIANAIRLALTGRPARGIEKKKDYISLVTRGSKSGEASVSWMSGEDGGTCVMRMPAGKHIGEAPANTLCLDISLEPSAFRALPGKDRADLLFSLARVDRSPNEIMKRLFAAGVADTVAKCVYAELNSGGFDAAQARAEAIARDAKADWRAATGETWGREKGMTWQPERPEFSDEMKAELAKALDDISAVHEKVLAKDAEIGELRIKQATASALDRRRADLAKQAGMIDRIKGKLDADEIHLAEEERRCIESTPKAGDPLMHTLAAALEKVINRGIDEGAGWNEFDDAGTVMREYKAAHGDPLSAANPLLVERHAEHVRARDLMRSAVSHSRDALRQAEAAKNELATMEGPQDFEGAINAATEAAAKLRAERLAIKERGQALQDIANKVDSADALAVRAAVLHDKINAFVALAELLRPDALPAQMVADAIGPINATMAAHAVATGAPAPRIEADMEITGNGLPYALLSGGEQVMVDAILSATIAKHGGTGVMMIDRFDTLSLPARSAFLIWLADLAEAGDIETAVVFATLKSEPTTLPKDVFQVEWLSGATEEMEEAA